jgi:hypothetical protein
MGQCSGDIASRYPSGLGPGSVLTHQPGPPVLLDGVQKLLSAQLLRTMSRSRRSTCLTDRQWRDSRAKL